MKREDVKRESRITFHASRIGVCMIVSTFYPVIGGAERQAQQLAARLIRNGVEVCILTRRYPGLEAYEEIEGVPIHRVFTLDKGRVTASVSYTFSSLLWLSRNQSKYQIIHCHRAESPAVIGVLAKLLYGKQVVVKISGTDLGLIDQNIRKKLLSAADVLVALTYGMRDTLTSYGFPAAKIKVIPNGVDTNRYVPASREAKQSLRESLAWPKDGKFVIFVGGLRPIKGLDTLVYAWQKISQSIGDKARLLILGDGSEEASLRNLVGQLDIENSVLFPGSKMDVVRYLQAADVFVLPSLSEGLPNALLEAMACGLPVVATNVGGNTEVISDLENGILVEPKDSGQLAEALTKVLNNGGLAQRLGGQARKAVEEKYSLESVVDRYLGLYEQLISQA